jgi:hypothetical protein
MRDDGIDIDLPSREEIEGALKNGGPNLVNALNEVIQQP